MCSFIEVWLAIGKCADRGGDGWPRQGWKCGPSVDFLIADMPALGIRRGNLCKNDLTYMWHIFGGYQWRRRRMVEAVRYGLVLAAFLLLAACGNTISDAEYVQHAQDFLDKGDLNSAAIELKNALQRNPNNPQARRLLGDVQFELGDLPGAEKELRRARELGVADDAVLPLLARVLLGREKYKELDALSPQRVSSATAKAEVLSAQGLGKLARGKLVEAQKLIDAAIKQAPDVTYAGVARARLLASNREYTEARKELDRVLRLDARYALAWSTLGALQQSQDQLAEAETSYSNAIENRLANSVDLLSRAMVRIQLGKYEAAQKDVDILLKRLPQHPTVNIAQGLLHLQENKLQAAKESFELSLRSNDRQLLPKYYLALINLRLGNIEQADDYGEQALAAAPNGVAVRELLAAIKLKKQEFGQAEDLVRPIVAVRKDDIKALDLMASALIGQQKASQAVPLLEKVIALQPDSATAELRLGAALLAAGSPEPGVEHLENSLAKDPGLNSARLLLVRHYVDQKNLDKAMQVAKAYRDNQPDSPSPWNLIGGLFLKQGEEQEAVNAFERARKLAPGNPGANYYLAALAVKAKDYKKARSYYEDVLAHHKGHLDTLLKLVALDAVEKKEPDMVSHLKQATAAHPEAVVPNVMLARYYLVKGEADKVAPLMVELSKRDKNTAGVLEVMAYSQLAQKQYSEAKYSLEQLVERTPKSAQLHFLLAQSYAGLNDVRAMEQELHRTVDLAPEHIPAHIALAHLAMRQNQKEKMQEQLEILEKLAPEQPDVIYLKAILARAEGNQKEAEGLLEEVFAKAPNTETMLSTARQKWIMGDPQGALKVQEEWADEHPADLVASLGLAAAYSKEGDRDKAIVQYEKVLQKDDKNVVALNDLAWNLREKQPAKALEYAKKASELAPDSASILDTLAMVQLSNKQVVEAQRTISRALEKAPNKPSLRYHSALIAVSAGRESVARQTLESLLGNATEFPQRKEAEELLRKLTRE